MYKYLDTTVKEIDKKGVVVFAANAFGNEDSDGDISASGSFDVTLREHFSRAKWFLNHNREQLLGVLTKGRENGQYLEMTGQLNMDKELSRDTYSDYKLYAEHNRTLEHSIGVNPVRWEQKEAGPRTVIEWKLWEVSTLTSWGANENTPLIGIKGLDKIKEAIEWLTKMLKGNYTDEKFKLIEETLHKLSSLTAPEIDKALPLAADVSTTQELNDDQDTKSDLFLRLQLLKLKTA